MSLSLYFCVRGCRFVFVIGVTRIVDRHLVSMPKGCPTLFEQGNLTNRGRVPRSPRDPEIG